MYAFVCEDFKAVFNEWSEVRELRPFYPYASFRKFYSRDKAEAWLATQRLHNEKLDLNHYGNVFSSLSVDLIMLIKDNIIYSNLNTSRFGEVFLDTKQKDVIVDNFGRVITIEDKSFRNLNENLILTWIIALNAVLKIVGDDIDINFIVPDHSIYFALTMYEELPNIRLRREIERLFERRGGLGVTFNNFRKTKEYEKR